MTPIADPPPVERRQDDLVGAGSAKVYLFSAVGLSALTLVIFAAIILTQLVLGQPLDTTALYFIAWIVGPIVIALFAAAGINVVSLLNGHQAMVVRLVAEKERAKGQLEGLKENPNTNIS